MILEAIQAVIAFNFERPELLWGVPIAAVVLLFLMLINLVKSDMNREERHRQRRKRVWMFVSRLFIVTFVLVALAQPYGETSRETQGNPRVTVITDNSGSMQFLDTTFADGMVDILGRSIRTTERDIGTETMSDIGSAIMQNLEPGGNILLISDGNANTGPNLDDVSFYATTINASISAINLSSIAKDSGVLVQGPGKVVADSEATYTVVVTSTEQTEVPLRVEVDGTVVLEKNVLPGRYSFTRTFTKGTHKIQAMINDGDAYEDNNVFYKSVSVLAKPKILYVSEKNAPLELLLRRLYDVDKRGSLPSDLSPYYAVIINDVGADRLNNAEILHDFLIDEEGEFYGGGLVVFGGLRSFDRGGYKGSRIEQFLPVFPGKGERKKGEASLVFVLDMSGSTGGARGFANKAEFDAYVASGGTVEYSVQELEGNWQNAYYYPSGDKTSDVIKAQAVNAIEQLKIENRVGVIAFGLQPGNADSPDEFISESVKIIEPLDRLYNNRQDVLTNIPRIIPGGPTAPDVAVQGAVQMLQGIGGDKSIVLLTNGRYSAGLGAMSPRKQQLLTIAHNAQERFDINFMTIGVGVTNDAEFPRKVDESFMKELAAAGDGTYDRGTKLNSLLVKWGDPKSKQFGQEYSLVLLSLTHFITRDITPTAVLNGYNEVVPKDTAELLITTDSGQPTLTVWRYGNGRAASWNSFAGTNLGQLLNEENSLLISRTVNWAIGDPQRKEAYFVEIPDARIDQEALVSVRSDQVVTSEALDFSKNGNRYEARFSPTTLGFNTLLGQEYGVNRPSEYDQTGWNPRLAELTSLSGGKIFKPSDTDAIIEHAREVSRRVVVERENLSHPFIIAAAILLLIEIFLRRITERRP